MGEEKILRLDKVLTELGVGSRSEVKKIIRAGRVTVDGQPVRQPEMKLNPGTQQLVCDGQALSYTEYVYYMLHKPAGVLSAARDARQPTVLDLLTENQRSDVFPIGRLDKDTEGLLLISNDGDLAHRLLSPRRHVRKIYYAVLDAPITEADRQALMAGVDIGEERPSLPAWLGSSASELNEAVCPGLNTGSSLDTGQKWNAGLPAAAALSPTLQEWAALCRLCPQPPDCSHVLISIREGRFHQIKRMFAARGREVRYLKRLAMGSLLLDEALQSGEWRPLSAQELAELSALAGAVSQFELSEK